MNRTCLDGASCPATSKRILLIHYNAFVPELAPSDTINVSFRGKEVILNWVWAIALIAFYIVLTRWILPKFGVPT
jgi:hypothetical protein